MIIISAEVDVIVFSPIFTPPHRMMGIARSSVLCFVIDTTGSMSDDIAEARRIVYELIDRKKGTQDEPSEYILVPFNDPGVKFILLLFLFSLKEFVLSEENKNYNKDKYTYILCLTHRFWTNDQDTRP